MPFLHRVAIKFSWMIKKNAALACTIRNPCSQLSRKRLQQIFPVTASLEWMKTSHVTMWWWLAACCRACMPSPFVITWNCTVAACSRGGLGPYDLGKGAFFVIWSVNRVVKRDGFWHEWIWRRMTTRRYSINILHRSATGPIPTLLIVSLFESLKHHLGIS